LPRHPTVKHTIKMPFTERNDRTFERSSERTIAMLRRKLAASETCLNQTRLRVVEMMEFVRDTDITDEDDVALSNNFVIEKSEEILTLNLGGYETEATDEETEDESEDESDDDGDYGDMPALEGDYGDMPALEGDYGDMPALEGDYGDMPALVSVPDCEMDDRVEYNEYMSQYENITINGQHYYHDKYGASGETNLLMRYDSNGDLVPMGFYNANNRTIDHEVRAYQYGQPVLI
jgi:hypothetical protein